MLQEVSKLYEVIVFTASCQNYADPILDYIDPEGKWIQRRLYRQHCIEYQTDVYIKDLRVLNRDLKTVLIVDNAPYAFAAQLSNGYPIIPFYDNKEDQELEDVTRYLLEIKDVDDVRVANKQKFQLQDLAELNIETYVQYYQSAHTDDNSPALKEPAVTEGSTRANMKKQAELQELQELHESLQSYFNSDH